MISKYFKIFTNIFILMLLVSCSFEFNEFKAIDTQTKHIYYVDTFNFTDISGEELFVYLKSDDSYKCIISTNLADLTTTVQSQSYETDVFFSLKEYIDKAILYVYFPDGRYEEYIMKSDYIYEYVSYKDLLLVGSKSSGTYKLFKLEL